MEPHVRLSIRRSGLSVLFLALALLLVLGYSVRPSPGMAPALAAERSVGTPGVRVDLPFLAGPLPPTPTATPTGTPTAGPTATPTPTSTAASFTGLQWDQRLTERGAVLVPAQVQPGQGYWQLVVAKWYDPTDQQPPDVLPMGVGDHDIAVDVLDGPGARVVGKTVAITWDPQQEYDLVTEAKPGEQYAQTFGMYHIAPTYSAQVGDGAPSDAVDGLGMGSILDPLHKVHTSYGFVWHWTIAPAPGSLTATPGPESTPAVPIATATPTAQPTSPVATATAASPSPTPTSPSGLTWDSRLTERGTQLLAAQVTAGEGYWRLVQGLWYDVDDQPFPGEGLILFDTLAVSGTRQTGVQIQVSNLSGTALSTPVTEAKPGELYAANFPMYAPAQAYQVVPLGAPADRVTGMGLGSLTDPSGMEATRYGFVWQWTIAGGATGSQNPGPGTPALIFNKAVMQACQPDQDGTFFTGTVTLQGQPAEAGSYLVVVSSSPDGQWAALPAPVGPGPSDTSQLPGHYSATISATGPVAGDWYAWVVNASGARVSLIAPWRSSGPGGSDSCNQATLNFGN